jgi:hypothetical protein
LKQTDIPNTDTSIDLIREEVFIAGAKPGQKLCRKRKKEKEEEKKNGINTCLTSGI